MSYAQSEKPSYIKTTPRRQETHIMTELMWDGKYKDGKKVGPVRIWCENASTLTGEPWRYIKVPQKEYKSLQPVEFEDLLAFFAD
jgi:hypothetical protein